MPLFYSQKDKSAMKQITFRTDILPMKDKLYRLALRITMTTADAEDVVQETLIRIWKKRDYWNQIESLEAWALTITRNLSLDYVRRNNNHATVPLEVDVPVNDYDRLQESQKIQFVKKLMESLPEKQRTAMQLRDFEEKTYKEIAEIMEISEEQVKVSIFRARQFIKLKYTQLYKDA